MVTKRGLIIRAQSGFYTVQIEQAELVCRLRGRLKRGPREEDIVAIGDWVQVTPIDERTGMIESVEERGRALVRKAPTPRGEYMQIIVANPDQAVFIFACAQPAPRFGMLDRFLVIAEKQEIPAVIVANKIDLIGIEAAQALFGLYAKIGYPVIYSSTKSKAGLEELREVLTGKISVFSGPSGAGKSSLLNALQPGLGLEVRNVSDATSKGRHTTVARALFPLRDGGYVADTPGLKALALWDMEPEELDGYFPEMRDLILDCEFNNCTHIDEFNCAIQTAVDQGTIPESRYQSYVRMRTGQEEEMEY